MTRNRHLFSSVLFATGSSRTAEARVRVYRRMKCDHPCDDRKRHSFVEGPKHWFSIGQLQTDHQYNGILRIGCPHVQLLSSNFGLIHRMLRWLRSYSTNFHRCHISENRVDTAQSSRREIRDSALRVMKYIQL